MAHQPEVHSTARFYHPLLAMGLLLLAGAFALSGVLNLAGLFAGVALAHMFVTRLAVGRCRGIMATPLVARVMRTGWQLYGFAALVFAIWLLWYVMKNASLADALQLATPWLLALTPFFMVVGVVRAFKTQARKLRKLGAPIGHPAVLHKLATISQLFLGRTGVVTPENLTVQVVVLPDGKPVLLKGVGFEASQRKNMWRMATAATLANQATGEGVSLSGDGVDMAFARFARRMNLSQKALLRHFPLQHFLPFAPERGYEASFHKRGSKIFAAVKGAPEVVAALCGTPKADWLHEVENLAQGGYRTIAVAGGVVPSADQKALSGNLTFLGLVALVDPLKDKAAESISACQVAGVNVSLLCGDHPATTLVTTKALNLAARNDEVVSGGDLADQNPESTDFANQAERGAAFARLTPDQKQQIVAACAAKGLVTACYGHTAHDESALSAAHVAIRAQQRGGQPNAADIFLENGDIALLPKAFAHARLAVANARKAARFVLGMLVAQVGALVGFTFLGVPQALSPTGLLWVNVVLMGLLVLPFAKEPAEKKLMRLGLRPASEPLLNNRLLGRVVFDGAVMAAILVGVTLWHLDTLAVPAPFAQSLALNLLVLLAAGYAFFARTGQRTIFNSRPWQNPLLWGMVAVVLALQAAVVFNGALLHSLLGQV